MTSSLIWQPGRKKYKLKSGIWNDFVQGLWTMRPGKRYVEYMGFDAVQYNYKPRAAHVIAIPFINSVV